MKKQVITCISCPLGCEIETVADGDDVRLEGNRCPRGETYAMKELLNPERVVTSSILVENGICPLVSVKTSAPIPKARMIDLIEALRKIKLDAPVQIGQVIIHNVLGLGIDVIATRNVTQS
jgi:CxxC motif-containing protein